MKKEIKKTQKKTLDGKGKAKQASTSMMIVGILEAAAILTSIIVHIIISNSTEKDLTKYNNLFAGIYFPLAAATLVQLILVWVKTKAIAEHSKVSKFWTLIGYPIPYAAQVIVALIVVFARYYNLGFTNAEFIALIVVSSLAEAFIIVNSFVNFARIRKTLH